MGNMIISIILNINFNLNINYYNNIINLKKLNF